ncbi:MAG: bifunctional 5,10-methylenetetrahydrofolate dehydrogenase/5,10-methenyltetrahydrofolate cyclohydrolase [Patescibacteria group bacterium]
MIVDGAHIAKQLLQQLKEQLAGSSPLRLKTFACEPNFETKKFIAIKQRAAAEVGIGLELVAFGVEQGQFDMLHAVQEAVMSSHGVMVQLPFPARISVDTILSAIPPSHDVDALMYDGTDEAVLPPVVGAIKEIARVHSIDFKDKQVTVVGNGRLVGSPSAVWARQQGAAVSMVTKHHPNPAAIKEADIVILGAGTPALIKPKDLKEGVVVFDAGTSESAGSLAGDADPAVADVASLFTPVPGGIGPVAVVVLLRNLVQLASRQ